MHKFLLVGLGGFFGAVCRFSASHLVQTYFKLPFPFATLFVNTAGCFAIGLFFEFFRQHPFFPALSLLLVTGFLGAFTTFSAFGMETILLIKEADFRFAALNIMANLILSLAAVVLGSWAGGCLR